MATATPESALQPAQGAYCQLERLLQLRFSAKDLSLKPRRKALSHMAGPNATHFRGRGIDFEEVRSYQPGDDVRSIDWRVTARVGRPHTKLYSEERERPVFIISDQRPAMFFGSRCCFKSVLAAELTALVAWAALHNSDRVGGAILADQLHEVKPRRSHHAVLQLLRHLEHANHQLDRNSQSRLTINNTLQQLNRLVKPGTALFLISDLEGLNDDGIKQLYQLAQHNDVNVLFTYDAMEQELPRQGNYSITNNEQQLLLNSQNQSLQQAYSNQFQQQLQQRRQALGRIGIPLLPIATHQSALTLLSRYYGNGKLGAGRG